MGSSNLRNWLRKKDPRACKTSEEHGGLFIGRRHCSTHHVVWDDGGRCPREGGEPGQPFAFARNLDLKRF